MQLKSGEEVVDRYKSHVHPGVKELLRKCFTRIDSFDREYFAEEIDLGRVIGKTICVHTYPGNEIVYARRRGRNGHSRFVMNRHPESTSKVTVILKKVEENGSYILITAFVGKLAEPEPWDRNATEKTRQFWDCHALVWGSEKIVPGTLTRECPWQ